MNSRIDALSNDRSDRQLTMMNMWQDRMLENQQNLQKPQAVKGDTDTDIREKIRNGEIECPTCKNRKYVDGSDDAGVSFKTPTSISAGQSKMAVLSHEREHVTRNAAEARAEDREVTHSSISLQYANCPDCGRQYVAGGVTRTVTQGIPDRTNEMWKNALLGLFDKQI